MIKMVATIGQLGNEINPISCLLVLELTSKCVGWGTLWETNHVVCIQTSTALVWI